jgi:parallel beta-helix repeat protein
MGKLAVPHLKWRSNATRLSAVSLALTIALISCNTTPQITDSSTNRKPWKSSNTNAAAVNTGYLSDQEWLIASSTWGPVAKNLAYGEGNPSKREKLMLSGTPYEKGLGTHADSSIIYKLDPSCSSFKASIGIDDQVRWQTEHGNVLFQVYGDNNALLFDSKTVDQSTPTKDVDVNISGQSSLKLVVDQNKNSTEGDQSDWYDHADWANARVECAGTSNPPPASPPPASPPPAPTPPAPPPPTPPALPEPKISPYDFGAKGDGITDDTAALNAAAQEANLKKGTLTIPAGTFIVTDWIRINRGVQAVVGTGGIIKLSAGQNQVGLLMPMKEFTADRPGRLLIQDLTIDANNMPALAIYGQNVSNVDIIDNKILNNLTGQGILLRAFAEDATDAVKGNVIRGNLVSGFGGYSPGWDGIGVDANISLLAGLTSVIDHWKQTFEPPKPAATTTDNVIENNHVIGGYYGISISAASNTTITRNTLEMNMRNISMQNRAVNNLVMENTLRDSVSSSVHLAYGSSNNRIEKNDIRTARAGGEGLLQAYVESQNNSFIGNSVTVESASGPTFFAYTGTHSVGNKYTNNVFVGPCSKAYFGVESGWNTSTADPASRAYNNDPVVNNYAARGSKNVMIANNQITATSVSPVFFLGQTSDQRGVYGLEGVEISNNSATVPEGGTALRLAENTAGASLNHVVVGNRVVSISGGVSVASAPRARAHFVRFSENTGFDIP